MSQAASSRVKVVPKSRMLAHPLDWPRSAETVLRSCYCVAAGNAHALCTMLCNIEYRPTASGLYPLAIAYVSDCSRWLTLTTLPLPESASGTSTVGMRALPLEGLAARSECDLLWLRLIFTFDDSSMQLKLQAWHQASLSSGMCV